MEPDVMRMRFNLWSTVAPMEAGMRYILTTTVALTVFTLGMSASMAQQNPGKVTVPQQTSPQVQTQPAPIPNLNTSKNPYDQKRYMQTPVQQPNKK